MADIFAEVDEALKQEKMEKLWNKYGGFFIGFLAIIILGTAANASYKHWKTIENTKQTDVFLNIIDKENYSASNLVDISADLKGGLHDISKIQAAGIFSKNGEDDKALLAYSEIANDSGANKEIRQLASYMVTNISNDISAKEKLVALAKITSDNKNPWQNHARLDSALIEANINQNYTKARSHLAVILNTQNVPQTLKQKAQSLDIIYSLKEKI